MGGWKWTGSFTALDLIASAANALNGALLARRPDHHKNFTVVGILLMALLMGLGGGITRDVLLNQVPAALTNPAYITVCLVAGSSDTAWRSPRARAPGHLDRNQVRFAGAPATVPMLTEPTSAQRDAFELLGVPIPLTLK